MNYREEMEEGTIFLEPEWLDEAIIGHALVRGGEVLIYSYTGLIEAFQKNENVTYEDAEEWVSYNTLRALDYMGDYAPIVVYLKEK